MKKHSQMGMGGPPMGGAGGGPGAGIAAHPLMSPPPGAMLANTPAMGGAKPPMPAPSPLKPTPGPTPPAQPQQPQDRTEQVRQSFMLLRNTILDLAQKLYEIPLTEEQVREIAARMLETFSDNVNHITVDRAMDIGHDLIGFIRDRSYKKK